VKEVQLIRLGSLPVSLRWAAYIARKSPKGGLTRARDVKARDRDAYLPTPRPKTVLFTGKNSLFFAQN